MTGGREEKRLTKRERGREGRAGEKKMLMREKNNKKLLTNEGKKIL